MAQSCMHRRCFCIVFFAERICSGFIKNNQIPDWFFVKNSEKKGLQSDRKHGIIIEILIKYPWEEGFL